MSTKASWRSRCRTISAGEGFWRKKAMGRSPVRGARGLRSTKNTPKCWATSGATRMPMPQTSASTAGTSVASKSSHTSPEVTRAAARGPASASVSS